MKRCIACEETFEDSFEFCPVDGTSLYQIAEALPGKRRAEPGDNKPRPTLPAPHEREFRVTMVDGFSLPARLATEVCYVFQQLKQAWPDLKRDPIGVVRLALAEWAVGLRRFVLAPHVLSASLTAISVVLSVVLTLIAMGSLQSKIQPSDDDAEEPMQVVSIAFPVEPARHDGSGVGIGSTGRVGITVGRGEGSESESRSSRGGGGGGDHNPLPATRGKVPQPSEMPAAINPPLPNPALPLAGVDLDPALWRNLPFATYGDPRSKSSLVSQGPGDGGGMGTGSGQGLGEGRGNGIGPGENGNIGDGPKGRGGGGPGGGDGHDPRDINRIFKSDEVTQRARVISKPEPQYTEEARRNQITGTAVLRVVFSLSGEVTNIRAIQPLPMGLTEKAIAAARQIRFLPAMRNGHPVSVYVQLEYNFNLY